MPPKWNTTAKLTRPRGMLQWYLQHRKFPVTIYHRNIHKVLLWFTVLHNLRRYVNCQLLDMVYFSGKYECDTYFVWRSDNRPPSGPVHDWITRTRARFEYPQRVVSRMEATFRSDAKAVNFDTVDIKGFGNVSKDIIQGISIFWQGRQFICSWKLLVYGSRIIPICLTEHRITKKCVLVIIFWKQYQSEGISVANTEMHAAVVEPQTNTSRVAHSTNDCTNDCNSNSMENLLRCNSITVSQISTICCTSHGGTVVVPCAKFRSNWFCSYEVGNSIEFELRWKGFNEMSDNEWQMITDFHIKRHSVDECVFILRKVIRYYSKQRTPRSPPYLSSYPGYSREPHWLSVGLPEIFRVS